jgi:hypothetical protein
MELPVQALAPNSAAQQLGSADVGEPHYELVPNEPEQWSTGHLKSSGTSQWAAAASLTQSPAPNITSLPIQVQQLFPDYKSRSYPHHVRKAAGIQRPQRGTARRQAPECGL